MKLTKLSNKTEIELNYKIPFSFEKTFYNPSHFKSGLELYENGIYYMSINFKNTRLGLKFSCKNKKLFLNVFSKKTLNNLFINDLIEEINYRFTLNVDYSIFFDNYRNDKYLKDIINRNYGKHISSMYSLYENLIISTFLQNATIKRTIDMTYNMLSNYGKKIKFDDKILFSLWEPKELNATDEELRKLKVGYRSKNILRITKHFVDNDIDEIALRKLTNSDLEKELLKIYGVGKQTVFYLMLSQFHRTNFLKHIPLWERKIISKYIFNEELCSEKQIIDWLKTNYDDWYGFVLSLIVEDIFFKHEQKPFPWLKKILRED